MTRSATDEICRTARTIIQATSDVEKYVLKRFPLTESPYEDIDAYRSKSASPVRPQRAPSAAQPRGSEFEDELAGVGVQWLGSPGAWARNTIAAAAGEHAHCAAEQPRARATVAEGVRKQGSITLRPSVLRADLRGGADGGLQQTGPRLVSADLDLEAEAPRRPHSASEAPAALLRQLHDVQDAMPEMPRSRGSVMPAPQQPARGSVMLAPPPQPGRLSDMPTQGAAQVQALWHRGESFAAAHNTSPAGAESPASHALDTPVREAAQLAQIAEEQQHAARDARPGVQRRSTVPDLSPEDMADLFAALDRKTMSQQDFLEALFAASGAGRAGKLPLGLLDVEHAAHAQDVPAQKASDLGALDAGDEGDAEERISAQPEFSLHSAAE